MRSTESSDVDSNAISNEISNVINDSISNVITPERAAKLDAVLGQRQPTLTIVLENVHDPHNIGAVVRSCDATGVLNIHGVYSENQPFPTLGGKSSASARKWVDVELHTHVHACFTALRARGFRIYTTHMSADAQSIYDIDFTQPTAIVFGNEHDGVSDEALAAADGNVLIPQRGIVQSLNISVACAVTLFEAMRQRTAAGMYTKRQLTDEDFDRFRKDWYLR